VRFGACEICRRPSQSIGTRLLDIEHESAASSPRQFRFRSISRSQVWRDSAHSHLKET
jgi:hypothetical protein